MTPQRYDDISSLDFCKLYGLAGRSPCPCMSRNYPRGPRAQRPRGIVGKEGGLEAG